MKFTYQMRDAWGDDYELTVEAVDQAEAHSIAVLADDDAVPDDQPIRKEP